MILNLYIAKVVLSRVILGGSLLSWESRRGCRLLHFGCTSFWGVYWRGDTNATVLMYLMQYC